LKALVKEIKREGGLDLMLKETEQKILNNSRLAVANSKYIPMMVGAIILSAVYSFSSQFFQWAWIVLAIVATVKHRNECKNIRRLKE